MDKIISGLLVIVGIINIFPIAVFFDPTKTRKLYGLEIAGENLTILMRHRGVLLSIIGVALIVAAFRPEYRILAIALALISKISFLFLLFTTSNFSSEIRNVAMFDVGALILLLIVLALNFYGK